MNKKEQTYPNPSHSDWFLSCALTIFMYYFRWINSLYIFMTMAVCSSRSFMTNSTKLLAELEDEAHYLDVQDMRHLYVYVYNYVFIYIYSI